MEGKKKLRKYLRPSVGGLVAGGFFLALGIAGLFIAESPLGMLALMALFALICGLSTVLKLARLNRKLNDMEAEGRLEQLIGEFEGAKPFLKDAVRLGQTHIFGKRSGNLVPYTDIRRIYQYIHKTNFAEDSRELRATCADGKDYTLCRLPLRGKQSEEVGKIVTIITAIQPGIHIGYH